MPEAITATTFEFALVGGDKVEVGDRDAVDFKPHIKLNRWDGECFIKVGLPTTEKPEAVVEGDKVKFVGQDIEAHFYALEPTTKQNELGGFEFEIVLKKKPASNKIVLDIETQGLVFHYQPALTSKEIADGAERPDNVVGSYAVYHATKRDHILGQTNYKTGKAFHIYRPKVTDAGGKEIWADLNIAAGTLTITIDQTWLDAAAYPVSIDPNFGYETVGASALNATNNYLMGSKYACSESGTIDSISVHGGTSASGTTSLKEGVYKSADKSLVGSTAGGTLPTNGWVTLASSGDLVVADYYPIFWLETSDYISYDSGGTSKYDPESYGNAFPDPWDQTTFSDHKFSIYCTYSTNGGPTPAAVGGGAVTIVGLLTRVFRQVIAVGAASIGIAGTLTAVLTKFAVVGGGAVAIAGTLARVFTQFIAVGGASISIAGALGRKIARSFGGASMSIASVLARMTLRQMGEGSVTIAGSFVWKALISVGGASLGIAGTLAWMRIVAVGTGAVAIVGTLARVFTQFVAVGAGAVSIVGTLARVVTQALQYIAVGGATMTIVGSLVAISEWIALTLKRRVLGFTMKPREVSLTLKRRSLSFTLKRRIEP